MELEALEAVAKDEALNTQLIWETNSAGDLVRIAKNNLAAEIAVAEGKFEEAITLLKQSVAIEDGLMYQEPPDWFFSVRLTLGHVMNMAGKYAEAETVFKEDLVTFPENGWALKGLYNALAAQGKKHGAADANDRFHKAWKGSDIQIKSSRIY